MSPSPVSEIKEFALGELGFSLVGIARAGRLPGSSRLRRWIRQGAHGEMRYMADTVAVREDSRRFLPDAASVVCVAMSYHDPPDPPAQRTGPDRALIARYARRADYHSVLRRRLVRLGRFLASRVPGARWRPAVDTAPLLERELAQQAGLGWIGKNSCLINRSLGSELLLGELVTDVPFPPDQPGRDHCGKCTACLAACPTTALSEPGWLDSRRCIAYLTIEHRGVLSAAQKGWLGSHLFGCDLCQAACPWNTLAKESSSPSLALRPGLADPRHSFLARLDEPGWNTWAAGTPLRRLSFARFGRNLRAIAGNRAASRPSGTS
ncbi:MAG: tRNA epoxyqueuosine(34) reductase QueG [Acidobacteriota bacterium]